MPWFATLFACVVLDLAIVATFWSMPGPYVFLAAAGGFGFLWMFASPFLVPMIIEADPTRRAAVLMGGVQLLGGSFGPLFASLFVTDADARGALGFGGVCVMAMASIMVVLHLARARPLPAS